MLLPPCFAPHIKQKTLNPYKHAPHTHTADARSHTTLYINMYMVDDKHTQHATTLYVFIVQQRKDDTTTTTATTVRQHIFRYHWPFFVFLFFSLFCEGVNPRDILYAFFLCVSFTYIRRRRDGGCLRAHVGFIINLCWATWARTF